MKFSCKTVLTCSTCVSALMWAATASAQVYEFNIPSESAVKAIPELARQAGIQIVAPAEGLESVRTPAIKGRYELRDALSTLLGGTNIVVAADRGETIVLTKEKRAEVEAVRSPAPQKTAVVLAQNQIQTAAAAVSPPVMPAQAQLAQATPPELPEQVLVTGSLIHGTAAVGVPVTTVGDEDFKETGALTVADVLKEVPSVTVLSSVNVINTGGNVGGGQHTAIHNIGGDTTGPKTLLMVDGARVPFQSASLCIVDPSIIPQLAIDRIDVLADGASATYGSDAVAGVLAIVLKRGFDGAITEAQIGGSPDLGNWGFMASQLYGRKWDTGDITITYETYHRPKVQGPGRSYFTYDYSGWGLDNRTPVFSAIPGIVSTGKPAGPAATPVGFDPSFGTTCTNCFSIPRGQNGVGLTWATILAHPGVQNEYNPYNDAWVFPDSTRNAAVITVDQDLWKGDGLIRDIQFFGDGFYNNRRQITHSAGTTGTAKNNALTLAIPTINPYYPVGAPSGLRVSYNFSTEVPGYFTGGEVQSRWAGGLRFSFPFEWTGTISYTKTEEHAFSSYSNNVNLNLANAALGNVVASNGVESSYTKPANLPYLNLFCDPTSFACNDPATLSYITGHRTRDQKQVFDESNATFDGPLFDLPGGTVRLAVGGDYLTEHYVLYSADGGTSFRGDAAPNPQTDGEAFNVWATFGQLNIPVIGDTNALPFIKSLEFEISGRIDGYSNVGTTKNPKFAVNWNVGEGLLLRGSMGTSFRAPTFAEVSPITNVQVNAVNVAGGGTGNTEPTCPVVGQPAPKGTAAAVLDPNCTAALQFLGGISLQGGSGTGQEVFGGRHTLHPESARNWTVGFEFSPTDFLKGLNVNSSYYDIKINGIIQSLSRGNGLADPVPFNEGFWILPTDPNFATYVQNAIKFPGADPKIIPQNIQFIEDRTKTNLGWRAYEGFDFAASYVWDMGDFGAWNTGITGDYVVNRRTFDGVQIIEDFKGKDSGGRLNYRARLGWAGGPDSAWSVTGFMNWYAHYGNQEAGDNIRAEVLPPACFLMGNPPCNASGLAQFAQYTGQYPVLTNYEPARVTFDLSLGYKTGDSPANDYLRNIGLQLVVTNILNKKPNFAYQIAFSGGSPRAFDDHQDPAQRVITFIITKVW